MHLLPHELLNIMQVKQFKIETKMKECLVKIAALQKICRLTMYMQRKGLKFVQIARMCDRRLSFIVELCYSVKKEADKWKIPRYNGTRHLLQL